VNITVGGLFPSVVQNMGASDKFNDIFLITRIQ